jgi:hypothetical protein
MENFTLSCSPLPLLARPLACLHTGLPPSQQKNPHRCLAPIATPEIFALLFFLVLKHISSLSIHLELEDSLQRFFKTFFWV